eukprot:scaffold34645_cov201-Amphora_coffeaeformis.AAC.8
MVPCSSDARHHSLLHLAIRTFARKVVSCIMKMESRSNYSKARRYSILIAAELLKMQELPAASSGAKIA